MKQLCFSGNLERLTKILPDKPHKRVIVSMATVWLMMFAEGRSRNSIICRILFDWKYEKAQMLTYLGKQLKKKASLSINHNLLMMTRWHTLTNIVNLTSVNLQGLIMYWLFWIIGLCCNYLVFYSFSTIRIDSHCLVFLFVEIHIRVNPD